jgi:succinate dehydrogenase / fumarate reductase, membrane anchor subunit
MSESHRSLRSALGRARYLGSARRGSQDAWRIQVSAAALVFLASAFVLMLLTLLNKDYNGVRTELGHPIPAILTLLFVLVATFHMHVGMRSIILDYVHGHAREWALVANICFAGAVALACVYAVLRVGFV